MGQRNSKPPIVIPQTQNALTEEQWRRHVEWSEEFEQKLISEIKETDPKGKPNLLMIGPVGSGKSSVINAIVSIGKKRKYAMAMVDDTRGQISCTSDLDMYTNAELLRGYNLMDTMGIEQLEARGLNLDDIEFLLNGEIKCGYKFNPSSQMDKKSVHYRDNPTLTNQCHCVILVVSSTAVYDDIDQAYVQKMNRLQRKIREAHIPRVLILTKVDVLCEEVEKEITNLYRSVKVRKAVKKASEVFGIEQASIHPVKNYEADYNVEPMTNIPILLALRQTMQYASDRVEYILGKEASCK